MRVDSLIWEVFVREYLLTKLYAAHRTGARRYLDFACGTGRILEVGSSVFSDCLGIDVSEEMLSLAKRRAPAARFVRTDVTKTPGVVNETFDCVTLFRFLLNAEPDLRLDVLRWLSDHMERDAQLIGNIHMNTFSIAGLLSIGGKQLLRRDVNYLSRSQLVSMLSATGFRVDEWKGFRILPTFIGRPPLGRQIHTFAERLGHSAGLGRFGVEQVFVARKM